jgi:hypothetical protein
MTIEFLLIVDQNEHTLLNVQNPSQTVHQLINKSETVIDGKEYTYNHLKLQQKKLSIFLKNYIPNT